MGTETFSLQHVARHLKLPEKVIQQLADYFHLPATAGSDQATSGFSKQDIEQLQYIYDMLEAGRTLSQVKNLLKPQTHPATAPIQKEKRTNKAKKHKGYANYQPLSKQNTWEAEPDTHYEPEISNDWLTPSERKKQSQIHPGLDDDSSRYASVPNYQPIPRGSYSPHRKDSPEFWDEDDFKTQEKQHFRYGKPFRLPHSEVRSTGGTNATRTTTAKTKMNKQSHFEFRAKPYVKSRLDPGYHPLRETLAEHATPKLPPQFDVSLQSDWLSEDWKAHVLKLQKLIILKKKIGNKFF